MHYQLSFVCKGKVGYSDAPLRAAKTYHRGLYIWIVESRRYYKGTGLLVALIQTISLEVTPLQQINDLMN